MELSNAQEVELFEHWRNSSETYPKTEPSFRSFFENSGDKPFYEREANCF